MSGTGKSSVLRELAARGHRTVDTDSDEWCEWVVEPDGSRDWRWREPEVRALLDSHGRGHLFVSGCKTNQGRLYPLFDAVVLLDAPVEVLLGRIADRRDNPYGKSCAERAEVLSYVHTVLPRLRSTASAELDASQPIEVVADAIIRIADDADLRDGSIMRNHD